MPSAIDHYESFLVHNVSTISTVESTLRSITWILPGRFKDAELASEALSALLNVTSLYHDTLLARIVKTDPKYKPVLPASSHTRYTRGWSEHSNAYKWASRFLEVVKYVELLVEMGLRRSVSDRARWRGVVFLEAIKATLRLLILRITRRPVLSTPVPERDFDPATLPPGSGNSSPTLAPSSPPSSIPSTPEHLKNNHVPLPTHPLIVQPPPPTNEAPIEGFLLSRALSPSFTKLSTSLLRGPSSPTEWMSEVLYILRPLIYVIMLSRDRRTNKPLMTALAVEFVSRYLRRIPSSSAVLERSEYAKRDRDIIWYLLRDSIWKTWTRPKVEGFADRTAHTPLLGILSGFIKDWIPLIDEYHYYTAP
ncbi:peroxisome membrane protein [Irpex rosettiformis]|uniref:Peroxisome membrane protein n=1 Tax=Irpex rosettiformis TaxID=378272 RepID=A0ACB8UMR6_9APHY|nr:peroxisome membrane protein [Irpex rosettiformis]